MSGPVSEPRGRRILLVEDEPGLVLTLTDCLRAEGYQVDAAGDGDQALARTASDRYDLIVLDVMLPGRDGFEVCRVLRGRGDATPVIMLTARTHVVDKVLGLKLGADDYVTKPFDPMELLARVEARLRRPAASWQAEGNEFVFGNVFVDLRRTEVRRGGQLVELTAQEFRLLSYFILHRGATLTRDELLDQVWGYDAMPTTRTVDTHVGWLRQKLEPVPHHPRHILTVYGIGYKFVG